MFVFSLSCLGGKKCTGLIVFEPLPSDSHALDGTELLTSDRGNIRAAVIKHSCK